MLYLGVYVNIILLLFTNNIYTITIIQYSPYKFTFIYIVCVLLFIQINNYLLLIPTILLLCVFCSLFDYLIVLILLL